MKANSKKDAPLGQKPSVFEYADYRNYVKDLFKSYPSQGRGQFRKLSEYLKTNSVTISQVFSGKRDFTEEQAFQCCQFLQLSKKETEYFMNLVLKDRAGHFELKQFYQEKLKAIQRDQQDLKNQILTTHEIPEEAKSVYYSDWKYSAIRILCSIPSIRNTKQMAKLLHSTTAQVERMIQFLQKHALIEKQGSEFRIGPSAIHLSADSPYVVARQVAWRLKATDFMDSQAFPDSLFYTGPCSFSVSDFEEFRIELTKLINRFSKRVGSTSPECLACLNIDYFRISETS